MAWTDTITTGRGWLLAAGLGTALLCGPALAETRPDMADLCATHARTVERAEGIPPGLMQAVALAESGRWQPSTGESFAWPWTVTSGSDTFYLRSKAEALAKVRELRAAGRTNIDVGCMQVNLRWHGEAFASLEQALEPARNVRYAADFLKRLRRETRSWGRATAHYHSRYPERGERYRSKVYRLWQQVRRDQFDDRRERQLAATGPVVRGGRVERAAGAPLPPPPATRMRRLESGTQAHLIEPAAGGTRAPGAIVVLRGQ